MRFGDRELDPDRGVVRTPAGEVELTPLESAVIRALSDGRVVGREELGERAWGRPVEGRAVDNVVRRLRVKIEVDPARPRILRTVRGVGWQLVGDGPAPPPSTPSASPEAAPRIELPVGVVDLERCVVERVDGKVALTPIERKLLLYLADRPGLRIGRTALLVDVWGWRPGLETRTVERAIQRLRHKIEVDPARPIVLVSLSGDAWRFDPHPADLGAGPTDGFVARIDEITEVGRAFTDGARLVTLVGTGGAGKTRLAREIALRRRAEGREPGGIWFVDLSAAGDAAEVADLVDRRIAPGEPSERTEIVIERIGRALDVRGECLLVVDNCEQAVDAVAACVARWSVAAPRASFLATSREPLRLAGERRVAVGPLGPDDAAALLALRTGDPLEPAAMALLDRLDRLPLAIELSAPRVRALGATAVLRDLDDLGLDAVGTAPRGAPERHRSLRTALHGSFAGLPEAAQQVLLHASVFAGGFDPKSLAAVSGLDRGTIAAGLEHLVDAHQLERRPGIDDVRYTMLHTVRAYAREQLGAAGAALERRHARHFAEVGYRQHDACRGRNARAARAWLLQELENVRAAYRCALRGPADDAVRAALALGSCRIPLSLHVEHLEAALALGPSPRFESLAAERLGGALVQVGRMRDAVEVLEQARVAAQRVGDRGLEALALVSLARVWRLEGRIDEGWEGFDRATAIAAASGSDHAIAVVGAYVATAAKTDREDTCEALFLSACAAADRAGSLGVRWRTTIHYCHHLLHVGRLAAALEHLEVARRIAVSNADPEAQMSVRLLASDILAAQDQLAEADAGYTEFIAWASSRDQGVQLCGAVLKRSAVRGALGRDDEALDDAREALELYRVARFAPGEVGALAHQGALLHARGRPEDAVGPLERAVALAPTVADRSQLRATLATLAAVRADLGDLERADAAWREAEALGGGPAASELRRAHLDLALARATYSPARSSELAERAEARVRSVTPIGPDARLARRAWDRARARHG